MSDTTTSESISVPDGAEPQLRYPELAADHPANVIDPDSDVPPVLQVDRLLAKSRFRSA